MLVTAGAPLRAPGQGSCGAVAIDGPLQMIFGFKFSRVLIIRLKFYSNRCATKSRCLSIDGSSSKY